MPAVGYGLPALVSFYYSSIPYFVPGISSKLFHFKFHNHLKSSIKFSILFYLFIFKKLFVCLATLGLNCGTVDLPSLLRHWESLVVARGPATGHRLNPGPLRWESRVLAPGPPGKSPDFALKWKQEHNKKTSYLMPTLDWK